MPSKLENHANVNLNIVELTTTVKFMLSRLGKFQLIIIMLLCVFNSIVSINHTLTSFHTYTPHYSCPSNNNTACPENGCEVGYKFEGESTSIVTEWNLVCSKRLIAPLVNTLYFAGVTIGALVCGTVADLWGRRMLVFGCLYIQCALGMLLYLVGSLEFFMVLRTIQGFFVQGLQGCTYTLILEYCPPNKRTGAGVLWQMFFPIGLIYLGTASYFTPSWRNLQIVIGMLGVATVLYIWMIPESLSWLLIKHRYQKAQSLSIKIAKFNDDEDCIQEIEKVELTACTKQVKTDIKNSQPNHSALDILKNVILRKRAAVMTSAFFSTFLAYYTTLFYLPNLAGERHLNFVLGAIVELIAHVIAYFVLSRLGRRLPFAFYQYGIGIGCLCVVICTVFMVDSKTKDIFIIVLALLIKGMAVSNIGCMHIYAGELFPTTCRAAAFGLCGAFGRIGSLLSPQVVILSEYTFSSMPLLVVGVAILITGTASFYLPETLNQELPNTIEDINAKPS